jgi:hypothetical protein
MTSLSDRDLDALRRAMAWGYGFQKREPQLKLFPDVMPEEGTPKWLALARHLASLAQSHHLGLKPWQTAPIDITDGAAANADEIALCQRMRDLNISIFEPDVPAAIDNARFNFPEVGSRIAPRRAGATRKVAKGK